MSDAKALQGDALTLHVCSAASTIGGLLEVHEEHAGNHSDTHSFDVYLCIAQGRPIGRYLAVLTKSAAGLKDQ